MFDSENMRERDFLISVIVPIYRVEDYINHCLDSIINQTYPNLEIILVDDGSPDNCPAICDEYAKKDSRIKVIHKKNGGLSDARNAGMDIATGDYIFFIDSDDWICCNDALQAFILKAKESDADIIVGKVIHSNNKNFHQNISSLKSYFETVSCLVAWNKLYKVGVVKNERFILGRIAEDMPFVSKLLFSKEVVFLDKETYVYFQREDSIAHTFNEKSFDSILGTIDVVNNLNMFHRENDSLVEIVKENVFSFVVLKLAINIYKNTIGATRREYFFRLFKMLDSQNLVSDFFYYASLGVKNLHKDKIKGVLKLIFIQYLKVLEHIFREQRRLDGVIK